MSLPIDNTDLRIIKHLVRDSRAKVTDIAEQIGITSAAIHQRLNKIKKSDIIKEYTARLDYKKLGYKTSAFVGVYISSSSRYNDILRRLQFVPEVTEVHYTTGKFNIFLKVVAKDNDQLMKVLNEKIQVIHGVDRIESFISLEESIHRNIVL